MPEPIEPPAPPADPVTPPAQPPTQEILPADEPKLFTQKEADRFVNSEKKKWQAQAEKAEADRKAAADQELLKEQGQYKLLSEQREQELADLRAEIAKKDLENLRIKVGAKYRLPDNLTKRLIGTTEAELEKDAAEVAKDVVPPSPGNTMNGGGYQPHSGKMTEAQLLEKTTQEQVGTGRYNF